MAARTVDSVDRSGYQPKRRACSVLAREVIGDVVERVSVQDDPVGQARPHRPAMYSVGDFPITARKWRMKCGWSK